MQRAQGRSFCEWKGVADYAHIVAGDRRVVDAGWTYPEPTDAFDAIRGTWAFYAQKVDECWIDDERVTGNEGTFYGGWVTADVVGPFKGGPGTWGW